MISEKMAERICRDWINAWNDRRMEDLLSLYSDDVELTSPLVVKDLKKPIGTIKGKDEVMRYYSKGFQLYPGLQYELLQSFAGVDSILIYYRGVDGNPTASFMPLDYDGLVKKVVVHYYHPRG
jgi:SnoaL-like domain